VKEKLIANTKKDIKKMLQESGYIKDQESQAPLDHKEAIGYMDLKVVGD